MANYTRRDLAKLALAALPASALLAKPNSRFGGVQIGINAPYSFHDMPADADSVLKDILDLGLSAVELRSQPVEQFYGAPVVARAGLLAGYQRCIKQSGFEHHGNYATLKVRRVEREEVDTTVYSLETSTGTVTGFTPGTPAS